MYRKKGTKGISRIAQANPAPPPSVGGLIRKRRHQRGLTLHGLGDVTGLSAGYLSQVERDRAVPTLGTLAQIADGLGLGLDYFISTPRPADALSRAEGRARFQVGSSAIVYEAVTADYPGSEMTSFILHVPPGYVSETVAHEGEELIVILEGSIEQTLGGEVMEMHVGDTLHYNGTTPHAWANKTEEVARVLWAGRLDVLHREGARGVPHLVTHEGASARTED
ncbi:MAG: XRE family transcriptional regulator [Jannaschia sp.]